MSGAIVSLELLLDGRTEAAVRDEWAALAASGLSSLAAHTAPSNRPHITLVVRTRIAAFETDGIGRRLPLPVTLGAPVLFGTGDRRVLARSVVPSPALVDLHRDLHGALGAGDDAAHTTPGAWVPHVTLARRLRLADLATALPLVGGELDGTVTALRRWDAATRTVTHLTGADA